MKRPSTDGVDRAFAAELCEAVRASGKRWKGFWGADETCERGPLVPWGWHPGGTRAPVPHDELVAKFKQWAAAGGPCPG